MAQEDCATVIGRLVGVFGGGVDAGTAQEVTEVMTHVCRGLPTSPDPNNVAAYVAGVLCYLRKMSPHFPVDARRVARNRHLSPAPPDAKTDDLVLVDADGTVYANPLSVILQAAHPHPVTRVMFRGGEIKTFAAAAPHLRNSVSPSARFVWGGASFPIAGAFFGEGGMIVRGPDGPARRPTWTHVYPGPPELEKLGEGPVIAVTPPLVPPEPTPLPRQAGTRPEQTSALKGARGEAALHQILTRGGHPVRDVSHRARSADMVVASPAGEVYVDSKSYTTAVPFKETQKFLRDIGARGAAAGVLVSLTSGIVGVRGVLTARLAALPERSRMVPLVYVASSLPEVILAGVSLAIHLARFHPETHDARSLHGQDALESYTVGLENLADLYEDARADLGRYAAESMEKCAGIVSKISGALRDHRRLAKVQRAAVDPPVTETLARPALWEKITGSYHIVDGAEGGLADILRRLGGTVHGDLNVADRWRFQKTKALHVSTGVALVFRKTRTEVCVPLTMLGAERTVGILKEHGQKVRVGDGALSLELGWATKDVAATLW